MIEINVTDPDTCSKTVLSALAVFFTTLAGNDVSDIQFISGGSPDYLKKDDGTRRIAAFRADAPLASTPTPTITPGSTLPTIPAVPTNTISSLDAPDVGAQTEDDIAAAEALAAFGGGVPAIPNVPVPPVSPPVVASALVSPSVHAPPGVEVDASGLPWDARIHSSNHEKNKGDGLWRARRNVDKELVSTVEAELRAVMAIPQAAGVPAIPNVPIPHALSSTPAPPVPAIMPVVLAAPVAVTFADLVPRVMQETGAGRMTQAQVAAACAQVGLANFPSLHLREDLVPQVFAALFPNG